MYEESASAIAPSIWSSMNSWFTPTVLFVILNVVIITIAFTSSVANQKHQDSQNQQNKNETNQPNNIASSLLHRLKSTNFYPHPRSQEPPNLETESHHHHYFFHQEINLQPSHPQTHQEIPQETQTHFVFEQKDSILDGFDQPKAEENPHEEQSIDEVYSQLKGSHFSRTTSDTEPASGHLPPKLPAKMRKSASLKSPFGHFEEEEESIVEVRRPATVRERGNARATGGDQEVDAKADDFINKFKQQLKLQRVDSIIRYKEMIGRGSGR